jgi:hypothetical protein
MLPILTFKGRWNAVTNTATLVNTNVAVPNALVDGVGTTGDCYIIYATTSSNSYNIYARNLGSATKSWIAMNYVYYDGSVWTMIGSATGGGGGTGTVTSVATAGLMSSGGSPITTSGTITTSMNTNKLVGRSTAGTGIMEEITVGSGLTLSAGTLSASAQVPGYEQQFLLMGA